jgi:nitrate/TMAO reductase-like tetraheme cytochrome c subunit
MAMTERQDRRVQEREEIAARVTTFKATQEKFQREREEFFRRTWQNIDDQHKPKPLWS